MESTSFINIFFIICHDYKISKFSIYNRNTQYGQNCIALIPVFET